METGKANNIQANTFNIDLSEQYHLSVQIGLNHFSYCLINSSTNNVEYFNRFVVNDDITNIINTEEILKLNFASSSVAFTNFPCALVPNELFIEENSKEILELTTDVYEIIKSDALTGIDAHLIYTFPTQINDIIFTFLPDAKQKAQQTILIEQFNKFDNKDDNAYLHINDNILNITAFRNSKLIFNNSFIFETKIDILYFTLFAFEQLKLNTELVNVKLYGEIIEEDENHQLLYEYIRNIEFGSRPNNLNFSSEFNELKEHQFYGLFSQET
tara:strand:+ start:14 stop:829 length:816 start_codon:yes stop_codon:yes gene_type:complete